MELRKLLAITATTLCISSIVEANDTCVGQVEPVKKTVNEWAGEPAVLNEQHRRLTEILKSDPTCGIAYAQLSRVYRKAGYLSRDDHTPESLSEALLVAQKSVQIDPDCYLCQWELGNVFLYKKDASAFEQQQGVLDRVAHNALEHQMTDLLKAQYQVVVKGDAKAAATLLGATSLQQPINDEWLASYALELGQKIYVKLGELGRAEQLYLKQIEVNPKAAWAYGNYSNFLTTKLGQHDKAIEYAKKSLSLLDYPMGHIKLATALTNKGTELRKGGQLLQSIPYYKEAMNESPSDVNASNNLGFVYRIMATEHSNSWEEHNQNRQEAIRLFRNTLSIDPSNSYARKELDSIEKWKTK